jgi:hypothetical protein
MKAMYILLVVLQSARINAKLTLTYSETKVMVAL